MFQKTLSFAFAFIFTIQCARDKKDTDFTSLALLALLNSSSCTTTFGAGVPEWIQTSFTCVTVSVSGSNYVFKFNSVPTYKSIYWGSSSANYETAMYVNSGQTNAANPNLIKSQNYTLTVPMNNTDTTATTSGFGMIGVSTNGIAIYNDQAAPGDSLSTEYYTFDSAQGHPTNTGAYHYHVEPPKISNNDSKLVGIAKDGYLIFGKKHDSTTASLTTGFTLGDANSSTKCTDATNNASVPTTWSGASNYNTSKTAGTARHYHVNNGTEVNGIILSGKLIGQGGSTN
ncbi:YHYH protein [Leptospira bandrabouensis]|uniref:YHYH protein n=1 Tax=Leptospira bandrabouensis TaxID=2484903 RepID=UPI00223D9C33|nr:YHYH protein [Leptospira bandrabouensis]MCW7456746.1 YHYH protein [Leptospira bandrabouensis]MCW7475692.1 YHYH protein [Leptospira bandrabouensis]MCW7483374.1 YHYH protein [Leptospira bandrabouensis]